MVPGWARTLAGDYITSVGSVGKAAAEKDLSAWIRVIGALFVVCTLGSANAENQGQLTPGEHKYEFSGWNGPAIEVLVFIPDGANERTPVVVVMHGWSRAAQRYFDDWKALGDAQQFIVVVPYFPFEDFDTEYPYGLQDAAIDEDGLKAAFGKELVLLLGREDTDFTDPDLRNTPAAKRQGKNCLARGLTMYYVAKTNAAKLNVELKWRVVAVEGADHNNAKMAPTAAKLIE